MRGSIRQREDRGADTWELRVYLGTDSRGRPRQKSVMFHGGKRAAERELARLVAEQSTRPIPVPEEEIRQWGQATTVNDAIDGWRDNGWADLSPKTIRGYEEIWERYVRSSIGPRKIATLNTYEVERFFRRLKDEGAGKDTIRRVRNVIGRACRLASKWSGGTLPNPVAGSELPVWPLSEVAEPVRSPDTEEVRALIRAAREHDRRFGVFVRLLAATGMRRGEACALRWSDIDSYAGTVRIDKSIVAARGGAQLKPPKTRSSIRTIALDVATLTDLEDLHASLSEACTVLEIALAEDGYVFSTSPDRSTMPHPEAMTHTFIRVRKRAGVASDIHLHSLRHFNATILDPVLPERQKQARMGWATVRMARHYTDAIADEDRRAAEFVGEAIGDA